LSDLGIQHICAFKLRFGGAWHKVGDRDAGVLSSARRAKEKELMKAWSRYRPPEKRQDESSDRAVKRMWPERRARLRSLKDNRSGYIRVDHMKDVIEILVQKPVQSARIAAAHRPAGCQPRRVLIHTARMAKSACTARRTLRSAGRPVDARICGNDQISTGALHGQFIAMPVEACYDCE
jgi:hypothetical protein